MIILNKTLWGFTTILIMYSGVFYFKKIKNLKFNWKSILFSFKKEKNGISSFEALTISLGSRIGVGSLAGIALSIYYGGIGSIFWIWIITILTAPNSFAESILAVIYQKKEKNELLGGPSLYIEKGLNSKFFAKIYSILIIITYVGGFLSIQTNTIALSLNNLTHINKLLIGFIISFISMYVIIKGIKYIAKFTSYLIPVMSIFYLVITVIVIIINIDKIPTILLSIIKEAFNFKALGTGVLTAIIIGTQRGIFATECGIGTGAIASGTSNPKDLVTQGIIQLIGVYFTTFIICTSTAIIILTSTYKKINVEEFNGIELTNLAFNYHLGHYGSIILTTLIIFFAFSTIISGYYYGESNFKHLCKNISNIKLSVFKTITFIILLLGSIIKSNILWMIVDILVAILSIINVTSILLLKEKVIEEINKYKKVNYDRKRLGFNFKR